jgi:CHAT domain-containing protein/Tfp pilus assembly protein PilF
MLALALAVVIASLRPRGPVVEGGSKGFASERAGPRQDGVVVDDVQPGFVGEKAGLRRGDVLLGWHREASPPADPEPAHGEFVSPFDAMMVEYEQPSRGTLQIEVSRSDTPLQIHMPPGDWRLKVRPAMSEAEIDVHEEARGLFAGQKHAEAYASWTGLARAWQRAGDHQRASWLFLRLGAAAAERRDWGTADIALTDAVEAATAAGDKAALALLHAFRGRYLEDGNKRDLAARAYREALEVYRAIFPVSLGEARVLSSLGRIANHRRDLTTAEEHHRHALAIREKIAPGSLDVASSLHNLGILAMHRGDLAGAEDHYGRALAIKEKLAPDGIDVAASLNGLASLASMRGDLAAAEDRNRRALAITERLAPQSLDVAISLNNLGIVAARRGDLAAAEEFHRGALRIKERLAPRSLDVATSLNSLGAAIALRGDLAAAEDCFRRALLMNEEYAPATLHMALTLNNLGELARVRRDTAGARGHLQRALAIQEQMAPRGMAIAKTVHTLGQVALEAGDLATAEAMCSRALSIRRELAPASMAEAETCHTLAVLHRRSGRYEESLGFHRCAMEGLEAQGRRLGASDEVKSAFGAQHASYHREAIDLLMELGRSEEAFQVLERYRARALLALLAERDLTFSADVPAELDRERRMVNAQYDTELAKLATAKSEELGERRAVLGRLRAKRAQIQEKIRLASPRLAALQYPRPLGLDAARGALDPGTALLSYSIGAEESYVFAVGPRPGEFGAFSLQASAKTLRADVERFRDLLQEQSALKRRQLDRLGRGLSATLLRPVADRLRRAERVAILPDGPLHLLPFAALADPGREGRYLVEAAPLHVAASATVFAELKKARRPAKAARVVAFGDPDYSAVMAPARRSAPELRFARHRGLELRPLPSSRREVDDLRRLFPEGSRVYVGGEATEDRAKSDVREASLLHFACHGLADESSPLDSALALTMPADWKPGQPNGLLQAWEIFEQVRVDADLVTLSACGTALGKEMSGEGILGLTRAFQYAGARSVLASLWAVRDDSTADLMGRFYTHLRDGKTKDAALRAAQVEMIRRGTRPGGWAAFQLVGDWQ